MAVPTYPGEISDGDAITAASINMRFRPMWQAIKATGVPGPVGINDDMIATEGLSPDKIAGTALTLADVADQTMVAGLTVGGDLVVEGNATFNEEVILVPENTGWAGGAVDVDGVSVGYVRGESPDPLAFSEIENGVVGQQVTLILGAIGNTLTVTSATDYSTNDTIMLAGADDLVLANQEKYMLTLIAINTVLIEETATLMWFETSRTQLAD